MSLSNDTKNRLGVALALQTAGAEVADAIDANTGLADGKFLIGDVNGVQAEKTLSGDVTSDREGVTAIGAGKVTQAMHVAASEDGTVVKVGADDNVIGAIPLLFRVAIAAGALATKNILMTHKIRVVDAWVVLTGAGVVNTVLAVGNAGTAITDTMAVSGADKALVRAATIDDAQHEIAAGANMSITTTVGATQPACIVYVLAQRVA